MKIPKTFPVRYRDTRTGEYGSVVVSFDPCHGLSLPVSFARGLMSEFSAVLVRDSSPWLRFFKDAQAGRFRILVSA